MSGEASHALYTEDEMADIFKRAHNEYIITKWGYKAAGQPSPIHLTPIPENIAECLDCGVGFLIMKGEPCAFCALLLRKRAMK